MFVYQILNGFSELIEKYDELYIISGMSPQDKPNAILILEELKLAYLTALENCNSVAQSGQNLAGSKISITQDPLQPLFDCIKIQDDKLINTYEPYIGMLFFTQDLKYHRADAAISLLSTPEKKVLFNLLDGKLICDVNDVNIDELYSKMLLIKQRLDSISQDYDTSYPYSQFCYMLFMTDFLSKVRSLQSNSLLDVDQIANNAEKLLSVNMGKSNFIEQKISCILSSAMILQQQENGSKFNCAKAFTTKLFRKIVEIIPILPFKDSFREKQKYQDIVAGAESLLQFDDTVSDEKILQGFVDKLLSLIENNFNKQYNHLTNYIGHMLCILYDLESLDYPGQSGRMCCINEIEDDLSNIKDLLCEASNTSNKFKIEACFEEMHHMCDQQFYQFWRAEQSLAADIEHLVDIITSELLAFSQSLEKSLEELSLVDSPDPVENPHVSDDEFSDEERIIQPGDTKLAEVQTYRPC